MYFLHPDGSKTSEISAELANTDSARRLGLMYRKEMAEDEGMLFIFPGEAIRSFWMKNTYLELDMIFIDKNFKVVSIIEKAVPLSESPRKSLKPATYVLELLGGQAEARAIAVGSELKVSGTLPPPS